MKQYRYSHAEKSYTDTGNGLEKYANQDTRAEAPVAAGEDSNSVAASLGAGALAAVVGA